MPKLTRPNSKHPGALTKDRVILAAIKLADAGGLEALSMRKLGRELEVEAMALYHHFPNKSHLIDGMLDVIHGEIQVPQGDVHWKQFMRSRAESAFEVLLVHPWAAAIMEASVNPGPSTLRDSDNCIKCFRQARFSVPMTVHAVTVLNLYIYGAAEQYTRLNFVTPKEAAAFSETIKSQFPIAEYPYLGEIINKHMITANYNARDEFYFGLELILDGLERLVVKP